MKGGLCKCLLSSPVDLILNQASRNMWRWWKHSATHMSGSNILCTFYLKLTVSLFFRVLTSACWPDLSMALTVNLIGPSPWGFRIFGGRDFKKAITVSKVLVNTLLLNLVTPYQTISSVFVKTLSVMACHAMSTSSSLRFFSCLCLYPRAAVYLFPWLLNPL